MSRALPRVVGTAQSVNVQLVTVASLPIVDGMSYNLVARCVGKAAALNACAATVPLAVAQRVSGTVTLGAAAATTLLAGGLAGVVVVLAANDTAKTVELQATGIALTTIDWAGVIDALEFSP